MAPLLFVRHSLVAVTPGVPAREWRLSDEGRCRAQMLAEHVAPYTPVRLVSSAEPKALATADVLGERLGLAVEAVAGLHEHARGSVFLGQEEFAAALARFFAAPRERVFGDESSAEVLARFSAAVGKVTALPPAGAPGALLIVTHGTALALYVAAAVGLDANAFWRALGLPALVALASSDAGARPWTLREVWPPPDALRAGIYTRSLPSYW
jgi:broad specificity phosphatase PhoE